MIVERRTDMEPPSVEFVLRCSSQETVEPMSYAGLSQFYDDRNTRDWVIGKGQPIARSIIAVVQIGYRDDSCEQTGRFAEPLVLIGSV